MSNSDIIGGIFGLGGAPAATARPRSLLIGQGTKQWQPSVEKNVAQYPNLDTDFVLGVMQQESGGKPDVVSSAGAYGPMQLMEATAESLGVDRTDPEQNIAGGVKLLSQLMTKYGDKRKALAAYNWGETGLDNVVAKYGAGWDQHLPEETKNYVRSIGNVVPVEQTPEDTRTYVDNLFGLTPKPLNTEVVTDVPHKPGSMLEQPSAVTIPESVSKSNGNFEILSGNYQPQPGDIKLDFNAQYPPKEQPITAQSDVSLPEYAQARALGATIRKALPQEFTPPETTQGDVVKAGAKAAVKGLAEIGKFPVDVSAQVAGGIAEKLQTLGWDNPESTAIKMSKNYAQYAEMMQKAGKTIEDAYAPTPEEQQAIKDAGIAGTAVMAAGQLAAFLPQVTAMGGEAQAAKLIGSFGRKFGSEGLMAAAPMIEKKIPGLVKRVLSNGIPMGELGFVQGEAQATEDHWKNALKQGLIGFGQGAAIGVAGPSRILQGVVGGAVPAVTGGSPEDILTSVGLGLAMPAGKSQRTALKVAEKPPVAGEPVGPSFAQVDAEANVGKAYTDKITAEQDAKVADIKYNRGVDRRGKIKELYGDIRPTKSQVKKDLGISREKAGQLINEIYGKAEQNAESTGKPVEEAGQPEGATNPAAVETPAQPQYERRSDFQKRKTIDEMSPEEAKVALKYDELTGMKSRRAWEDEPKKPIQAIVDADGLKWVNKNIGYKDGGDELLKAVGSAMKEAGVDAYRVGGDEIWFHANDTKSIDKAMKKVYTILDNKTIEATKPDGSVIKWKGLGVSYGYGTAESLSPAGIKKAQDAAVERLNTHKEERTSQGLRAARGEEPPGISRIPPTGNENKGSVVPFKKPDTAEDFPETKQASEAGSVLVPFGGASKPDVKNGVAVARQDTRNQVKNFFTKWLKSEGHQPEAVVKADEARRGFMNEQASKIEFAISDYNKARKGLKTTSESEFAINEALSGTKPISELPEQLQKPVQAMRDHVDALSNEFIRRGIVDGDLAVKFKDNIGFYLTRSYRAWDDPKWYKKVPKETVNRAISFLRQEMPDATDGEVQGALEELLFKHAKDKPGTVFEAVGKLGSKNTDILKKRGDIPVEIRALWGEYKNADVNYARSVSKMSSLIANHEFLKEVKSAGEKEGWLRDKPFADEKASYAAKLASENSKTMEPLNGLYTSPEIKEAFENTFSDKNLPEYMKLYMKAIGASRMAKTVGSPITHIRNVSGNFLIGVANGHFKVGAMGTALKDTFSDFTKLAAPEQRARIQHFKKIGLIGESVNAGELRSILKDATQQDIEAFVGGGEKVARKIVGAMEKLYGLEDDLWKIYAFENEKARYSKAMPELKGEALDRYVTDIIRNTYPTYSKLPRLARALRKFPFTGTFVSFPAEIIRTGFGIARQVGAELKSDNSAVKAIGMQRLAGAMLASSIPVAVGIGTRMISGVTQKEENEMRVFLPEWSKNSELATFERGDDGKIRYIDIGYTDPYSYLKRPLIALARGEDPTKAIFEAAGEALNPFFGEDIVTGKLVDVLRNKKKTGGAVYDKSADPGDIATDVLVHLFEGVEPGVSAQGKRFYKAATGQSTSTGTPYDLKSETISTATGLRVSTLDIPKSLEFKARQYKKDMSELGMYQRSKNKKDFESQTKLNDDITRAVTAARNLGLKDEEIMSSLRTGGISKIAIETILGGKGNALINHVTAPDFKPSLADAKEIWRESGSPGSWRLFYRQYQKATLRTKDPALQDIYGMKDEVDRDEAIDKYLDEKGIKENRGSIKHSLKRDNRIFNEFLRTAEGGAR
jgi:soluble lytic murein transglycosylase-like protein/GGDEF domain-containing protein